MKGRKIVYFILMFLPLVVTLVLLPLFPEQIPAHYGADGLVTRWGSKWELIILPAATLLMAGFFPLVAKLVRAAEPDGKNNEKVLLISGCATLLLFNVMTGYFLYTAYHQLENLSEFPVDINRIVFVALGIVLIIVGNVMPKARMNSLCGLRTPWSMKNEVTWQKSQRFGGISFIVAGAAMAVVSLLTNGWSCFACAMGILLLVAVVDVIYTYRVAKNI